jgi:hypothetical protein
MDIVADKLRLTKDLRARWKQFDEFLALVDSGPITSIAGVPLPSGGVRGWQKLLEEKDNDDEDRDKCDPFAAKQDAHLHCMVIGKSNGPGK